VAVDEVNACMLIRGVGLLSVHGPRLAANSPRFAWRHGSWKRSHYTRPHLALRRSRCRAGYTYR
jgi:hypothetical protein